MTSSRPAPARVAVGADAPYPVGMRHEIGIYTTSAATSGFYDRAHGRAGGAERQMTMLARALAERGHRVAHIVYPARDPVRLTYPLTLVHREPYRGGRRGIGALLEARAVWRALSRADARVVVLRSASPVVGVAALWCRLHRRALVFSSSNVSDWTLETMGGRGNRALYRIGIRLADAVVVQSADQIVLTQKAFPSQRRIVRIPSFAERHPPTGAAVPANGGAFLWFGRVVPQKQPLRYLDLARSLPEARFRMIPVPAGGDQRLLDHVRGAAAELPNVEVLDPLPQARLAHLIARSAAVVNTSTLEGMPNAFLEAWAQGVPVLTLEFDPDKVVAREALGVSAEGSWERFVAGAQQLWESRADRTDFARQARNYVESEHSPEAVAERWGALLEHVGRRRPGR